MTDVSVAALIAGTVVGLIAGVLMMMLKTQAEIDELQGRLAESIPKIEVLKAINCCLMSGRELHQKTKGKDGCTAAVEEIWKELWEDLV